MRKVISSNPDVATRSNEFVSMAKLLLQARGDIQSAGAMAEARNQHTAAQISDPTSLNSLFQQGLVAIRCERLFSTELLHPSGAALISSFDVTA